MKFTVHDRDEITGRVKKLMLEAHDARVEVLLTTLFRLAADDEVFVIELQTPEGEEIYAVCLGPKVEQSA